MTVESQTPSPALPPDAAWRDARWDVAALVVLCVAIYFTRLTAVPVCGEESRWGTAAREMLASSDWIVPTQQGTLFAERPPLGIWAIALVGLARGEVDLVAIRLPSAVAVLLTTLLVYWYARSWLSRAAGFMAAAIFGTLGQVMTLGRFGETDALFTLFAAGALLVWHEGYVRRRPMTLVWSAGYGLAALGALAKGLQAPAYFMAATFAYLVARRDWRWLIGRGHLIGLGLFALVVGLWMVPFTRAAGHALDDVWMGLAHDRFTTVGLARHLAAYPLETLACLLPWSPVFIGLLKPGMARAILTRRPEVLFVVTALAVTYPTVWLAAGARGRYYMALYPLLAVAVALVVEHCSARGAKRFDFFLWCLFLWGQALTAAVAVGALVAASTVATGQLSVARQPLALLVPWCLAAVCAAGVAIWASRAAELRRAQWAVLALAAFAGLSYCGAALNVRVRGGHELAPAIAELKQQLPDPGALTSLGRVYHRFAYSYEAPIPQVDWPLAADELPPEVTYFCFDKRPGDTPEDRAGNDDRLGAHTPGVLPFAWEKIAEIPCDPVKRGVADRSVVIGRVRHPVQVGERGATRPVRR